MSMRMLTIETRRTVGRWVFPIVAIVAGKFAYDALHYTDVLVWATSSKVVRDSLFAIGPFAAGAAAWVAGGESRRALADLLATTPRPELQRRLVAWAATVLWGVLAYLAVGALVVVDSSLHQAWGLPALWPMLTGLLAVLSHAAIGYALGYALRSRFTAPLVGIGVFAIQTFVADQTGWGWGQWLSPIARLETSVWYGVRPDLGVAQTLFLLGLVGLAWGVVALGSGARRAGGGVLIGGALLTTAGVSQTYGSHIEHQMNSHGQAASIARDQLIPYTPVCRDGRLPVCVHPAYQSQLPEIAALLNRMMEPLIGIPGFPTKAEQRPTPTQPDVLTFDLRGPVSRLTAYDFALKLVRGNALLSHDPGDAQTALQIWLMERAGVAIECVDRAPRQTEFVTFVYEQRFCDAARRFAAVDPTTQRAWLTQQYADRRADALSLEDLP